MKVRGRVIGGRRGRGFSQLLFRLSGISIPGDRVTRRVDIVIHRVSSTVCVGRRERENTVYVKSKHFKPMYVSLYILSV